MYNSSKIFAIRENICQVSASVYVSVPWCIQGIIEYTRTEAVPIFLHAGIGKYFFTPAFNGTAVYVVIMHSWNVY